MSSLKVHAITSCTTSEMVEKDCWCCCQCVKEPAVIICFWQIYHPTLMYNCKYDAKSNCVSSNFCLLALYTRFHPQIVCHISCVTRWIGLQLFEYAFAPGYDKCMTDGKMLSRIQKQSSKNDQYWCHSVLMPLLGTWMFTKYSNKEFCWRSFSTLGLFSCFLNFWYFMLVCNKKVLTVILQDNVCGNIVHTFNKPYVQDKFYEIVHVPNPSRRILYEANQKVPYGPW